MTIKRIGIGPRMSQAVIHGDTVYFAGQVGSPDADVATQTQQCLDALDGLLKDARSSKDKLLQITVWLADMADFDTMNAVYDAWVDKAAPPTRACGESRLAAPGYKVEIIAVAAI